MSEDLNLNLYELMPALYRIRDAEQGYPLRAFLEIIGAQVGLLKQNIDDLWDDLFIETCADWVSPYIGDLVGNNPLHEVAQRRRADVAKTIYYRRRKGTLPMLEELARDVTGWDAHAVAFFELLGWTQHLNHQRYLMAPNPGYQLKGLNPNAVDRVGTVNLRNLDALDRLDGPFDIISHTVDVRPNAGDEGWHNIRNIGFFLWRLQQYPMSEIAPRRAQPPNSHGYHFSPLGNPAPLFTRPALETDDAGLAQEIHIAGPIRPLALHEDLERCRRQVVARQVVAEPGSTPVSQYVGEGLSIRIVKDGEDIPPQAIVCQDLSDWARPPSQVTYANPADPEHPIAIDIAAGIDPHLGRISFANGVRPTSLKVAFSYGFSADMGGGPYDRRDTLTRPDAHTWHIAVAKGSAVDTLGAALDIWASAGKPDGVIEIADSGVYEAISIEPVDGRHLYIQAADRCRPIIRTLLPNNYIVRITGAHTDASLTLNGLLLEGRGIHVEGALGQLNLVHCTLIPGAKLDEASNPRYPAYRSVVAAEANTRLRVNIASSIVGSISMPEEAVALTIRDSIVDGLDRFALTGPDHGFGPPTTLERTTIFGVVHVKELALASEVIFSDPVVADRRQAGCVRLSYVPETSQTPRRYRCQPDLALEGVPDSHRDIIRARLTPAFTSVHYGHPAYAQLSRTCALEIRTGAEDGSEMGAFNHLKQPQREANLRLRLQEYLPFGLEPGLIYVT